MSLRSCATILLLSVVAFSGACKSQRSGTSAATARAPEHDVKQITVPVETFISPAGSNHGIERFRLVNQNDEIVSVLENGATVIVKRVPSPAISVRGYVRTGGVYEGKWLGGGLSHLLEHLVAGGSNKRRTEAENRDLLQMLGNNSNAYTSDDHTAYFINTTPEHLDAAADLLTGWLFTALITPAEYAREYEVVQRELEKGKGEPDRQFYYVGAMNRYRVSPARVPVIGYQEVIRGLSRDDVYEYYKLTYQPNNMVFSIAGDLPPEQMLAAMRKHIKDAAPGREFSPDLPAEPPVVAPRTSVSTFPKLGQAKLQLAFPTIDLSHPDLFALDLLATVLGQGGSSLLVEALRDKKQLVSAIHCGSATPQHVEGSFEIEMELDPEKISPATNAALEQLAAVMKDGVSPERVARAKVQMRTNRLKGQQTAEDIAASLATDFLGTGDPHFSDRYVEAIEKVTPEQLQAMAQKYFQREKLITTAMLPAEFVGAEGLPKAEDLIRAVTPTTASTAPDQATKVTRLELANGTVLLHKRITTTPLVAIRMYALGGVTMESATNNGVGNLAMEMLPRGTTTRTAQQIAEFFDSIGGDLDTTCGNNSWAWNATCLKGDLAKTFEVYADVVNNPKFADEEFIPVRQRVLAAIASQDADWLNQATRFFKKTYFGPKHSPYQFLPTGDAEIVAKLPADQARAWYAEQVRNAPRVLAVFGDVGLDEAKALAEQHLGQGEKLPPIAVAAVDRAATRNSAGEKRVAAVDVARVEVNRTEQPLAGVVIGYDSASVVGDPGNYPIIVGDTMSSGFGYPTGYLHEILRGRGLVYMVHAQNVPGRNAELPGAFLVYAGCDPTRVNEVVDVILENIARLQGTEADMQEGWFERSRQLAVTSDALENQTPADQATTAALDELYGLGYDNHSHFGDRINAVALEQVRQIARARLSRCTVTVSTPAPESVQIKTGERHYATFPPVDLTPKGAEHDAGQ